MQFISHLIAGITFAFASLWTAFLGAPVSNAPVTPVAVSSIVESSSSVPVAQNIPNSAVPEPATANANTIEAPNTAASALPSGSAWEDTLPLGDGKYVTSAPKQGYIYLCHVATGGRGAQVAGPWIHGTSWTPSEKLHVLGSVSWPEAYIHISIASGTRTISINDLPTDHTTGVFPISANDPASAYDRNPSSITAQNYSYALPASPTIAPEPDCIYGSVGVMLDGVLLLDGFDAEYRDAAAHELQDSHDGHPNDMGYHYHGFETDFVSDTVSTVVGFAFDGFPITGSKLPNGKYLHTADLDECHGITSTITLDGKAVTTYHYVLTQDFPYSVSCFRGKSFEPKPGAQASSGPTQEPGGMQAGTPGQPPQAALDACAGRSANASCSFSTPNGTMSGVCRIPPNQSSLACVPQ